MTEKQLLEYLRASPQLRAEIRATTRILTGYAFDTDASYGIIIDELNGFVANLAALIPLYAERPEIERNAAAAELITSMALNLSTHRSHIVGENVESLAFTLYPLAAQAVGIADGIIRAPVCVRDIVAASPQPMFYKATPRRGLVGTVAVRSFARGGRRGRRGQTRMRP